MTVPRSQHLLNNQDKSYRNTKTIAQQITHGHQTQQGIFQEHQTQQSRLHRNTKHSKVSLTVIQNNSPVHLCCISYALIGIPFFDVFTAPLRSLSLFLKVLPFCTMFTFSDSSTDYAFRLLFVKEPQNHSARLALEHLAPTFLALQ